LKRKYFITSFLFIITIATATFITTSFYFAKEREWLLDQQIEAIASGLLANELKDAELSEMDNIVAVALFDQPRTILLNIYNNKNQLIYQNVNSKNLLDDDLPPLNKNLFTHETFDHEIRFLNFKLPTKKTLQVGLLLDQQMSQLVEINQHMFILLGIIVTLGLLLTWIQANILVKPFEELTSFINYQTSKVELDAPRRSLTTPISLHPKKTHDELQILWNSLYYFKSAVETKIKLTNTTMAQMAHELKTPLTIIRNSFEYFQLQKELLKSIDLNIITDAIDETDRLNTTISRFLEWSHLESSVKDQNIHVNKLSEIIDETLQSCAKIYPFHTYIYDQLTDIQVFANHEDLRQLIRNLIENAFKYSSDKTITITLKSNKLILENPALPIPDKIFSHLGEPFNAGKVDGSKSIGLGLAWVCTICKHYQWIFDFTYKEGRIIASITFASV